MNLRETEIKPNWQSFEKRPSWSTVTTRELADILDTNIININNWLCRGQFPEPEPRKAGYGNKNRFRISKIRSWLENKPESEIHNEWIKHNIDIDPAPTLEQAKELLSRHWKLFDVERPI